MHNLYNTVVNFGRIYPVSGCGGDNVLPTNIPLHKFELSSSASQSERRGKGGAVNPFKVFLGLALHVLQSLAISSKSDLLALMTAMC